MLAKERDGRREFVQKPLRITPESPAFTVLLGVLAALPALSIDISAPTLPLLPQALGTSATVASLTLSLFVTGFAFGQLGGGRLSDRHGRRPILLAGLACYTLASIACTGSPSGVALLVSRFVQGLGAGACSVLSFAMVQDLFIGDAARAKRSYVTVVFGVVPMLAPAAGAFLSYLAGWRAVHGVLALAGGALLLIAVPGVAESLPTSAHPATPRAGPGPRLLHDPRFIAITLANALSYGCIFAYIAGSPMVIVDEMRHSSAVFAVVFASTAAALTAGAWMNGWLSRRGIGAGVVLNPSLGVAAGAALGLAAAGLAGATSGTILIPLLLVVMFARGAIAPNLQHLAIERWPDRAGVASAAVGVSQLLSGAAASAVVGALLPYYGLRAVAVPMALLAAGALIVWCLKGR
jgi:DHA1 family bicyclomycin/chloramphenicol resistance-like MFS transporter